MKSDLEPGAENGEVPKVFVALARDVEMPSIGFMLREGDAEGVKPEVGPPGVRLEPPTEPLVLLRVRPARRLDSTPGPLFEAFVR